MKTSAPQPLGVTLLGHPGSLGKGKGMANPTVPGPHSYGPRSGAPPALPRASLIARGKSPSPGPGAQLLLSRWGDASLRPEDWGLGRDAPATHPGLAGPHCGLHSRARGGSWALASGRFG